jgi:hypothetical protein
VTARRSPVELAVGVGVAVVQLVSAYAVLGRPDLRVALDFLTGTEPTMAGSIAAAQVVLWIALLVALVGVLAAVVTGAAGMIGAARRTAAWSLVVLGVGLVILAAGAAHRAGVGSGADSITGGSVQEARAQLAR